MTIERKSLPQQYYLYVDRAPSFTPKEIGDAMASGFAAVFGFVQKKGITPLSMPMAVYMDMPSGGTMPFRAGVFVRADDAGRAEGEVKSGVMPAGEAYTTTHVGPYANLNQTHKALWDHMDGEGAAKGMPVWEIYVDDPGNTPETNLRTQIFRATS
jgi:effector-binding domain-containing protein